MDGVRAYWDGESLTSKQANDIACPEWFLEALPLGLKLEGELWMGRNSFDALMTVLNSKSSPLWKQVKYVLFDMVDSSMTYESRSEALQVLSLPPFVSVVAAQKCQGNSDLLIRLRSVVEQQGEGFVLTKPHSLYVGYRTKERLKVKVSVLD